jgi:hypothetical protein
MATAGQRAVQRKRSQRVRKSGGEVAAIQALLGPPGPEVRLSELLAEQENASQSKRAAPSREAVRLRAAWDREAKALGRHFLDEVSTWDRGWGPAYDHHYPARELLHVYGPDVEGTGGDDFYAFEWTHSDPFAGTGSSATANRRTGELGASHYTTSGWLRAFGGVGVRLVPKAGIGILSVRPFVNWAGNDLLQHRVFDPQLGDQRWGVAIGRVGIIVQSRLVTGGDFRTDASQWIDVWNRAELNPSGARDYDGLAGPGAGLQLDVPATGGRSYAIWVTCNAKAFADAGGAIPGVATRSAAAISCRAPFLVVEEIPA